MIGVHHPERRTVMIPVSLKTTPSNLASDSTPHVKAALVAPALDGAGIAILVGHGGRIDELGLTVQSVPSQIHEPAAAIVDP